MTTATASPQAGLQQNLLDAAASAPSWQPVLDKFVHSADVQLLQRWLQQRLEAGATIYPPHPLRAFELTPLDSVRVLLLGQDPYHGAGQAHGLAFSVPAGVRLPPSLRNIFVELQADLGCAMPKSGDLTRWARQGVLLLNTVLTVEDAAPASHAKRGWEKLTTSVVAALAEDEQPKVFLLWGSHAQAMQPLIDAASKGQHLLLSANHPSPLAARRPPVPFMGCRHFSQANAFLISQGQAPIDWCLS